MAARRSTRASRTKPHTPTLMTRIRPAMFAAMSAPSRLQSTSTPTATGARTARATGINARMLIARIGTRASRTRLHTSTPSTPITRLRSAMFAVTSTPSRLPPTSTLTATGAGTARATGINARMLIARIRTKASRTRLHTSTPSTPITRLRPLLSSAMDLT